MTRRNTSRPLAACLSLLLAATLACSLLPSAAPKPNAPLTQAAATVTAAANLAATARSVSIPPTVSAPSPTTPPTSEATLAPSATVLPTEAASATGAAASATPETAATGTPAASSGVVLDPCTLVTGGEAAALIGVPVGTPKGQNGGCLFADAATGISQGVVVYALPASQAQYFYQQYLMQFKAFGVKVDPAKNAQLTADTASGDTVAAVNDLSAMAVGQPTFHASKVDGLGSTALWAWNTYGKIQEGVLVAANPGVIVAFVLVTGTSAKEADAQPPMQQIVSRILGGLPPSFTVAGLQVAGSAPAIDPCSLATASDAETILGTKAADGVSAQGECTFNDQATHKLLVRVYAFPASLAGNIINNNADLILAGDTATKAKVTADVSASDIVTALRDIVGPGQSTSTRTLESVDGLGDASVFLVQTLANDRISYLMAATPDVLVGVDMLLPLGDNAATKTAAVALATRILNNLPPKFTVTGAP